MKIDRLIGILSVLLQEEKITAPELAEKFEVSRRTIHRDIENLCKAGIPISTSQGIHGGISIMEGYRMDKTLLTSKDMQMILAGLRSLDSVSGSHYYGQLMEKIKSGSSEYMSGSESILIDLSSWYKDSLPLKIEVIQKGIEERKVLSFHYYAPTGESVREIEPYFLIFKWSSWYVWGWCKLRKDYRMFKVNRMDKIVQTVEDAVNRDVPMPDLSAKAIFSGGIYVKAVFQPEMKWHLIEEFGADSFEVQPDGTLLFEHEYTDKENLVTWMLTCKDKVTVLEPEEIRNELLSIADSIKKKYEV
ncbi:MAG: YafY family transcriptional regulator [Clostridiales bacterium]|nr:YafY family transcriptional regulator [Clostridiales bacterium]